MSYSSVIYLIIFLGSVFLVHGLTPKKYKWVSLLAASYVFYWINSGKLIVFILLSTAAVYFAGLFLNKLQDGFDLTKKLLPKEEKKEFKAILQWQKRFVVTVALIIIFGLLVFLKYYSFFSGTFNSLLSLLNVRAELPKLKLMLPLGISYYTLQAASYIIDVYRGKYRAERNIGKIALFLAFFPQIVEGPIGRYDLISRTLFGEHRFDYKCVTFGIQLIIWGMFKKLIIADRANAFVATVFGGYKEYTGLTVLIAGIMYTVQIYAEFSGCMDIVTGSAELFGVTLSKNFERPFFSKSINEFWRRWHITLGTWLKDYIFYTVSLSKVFMRLSKWTKQHLNEFLGTLVPAAFALLFVWLGNGFWHGSGWKYITYGMYYYVIMLAGMLCEPVFRKLCSTARIKRDGKAFGLFRIIRTTALVVVGMMLFRAPDVGTWLEMLSCVFTRFGVSSLCDGSMLRLGIDCRDFLIIGIATLVFFIISLLQEKGICIREAVARKNIAVRWTLYLLLIMSVIIFGAYGAGYDKVDFIYGQF